MTPRAAGALIAAISAMAEDWPQFRGPHGDGRSLEDFRAPLRPLWSTAIPGTGHSSPVVHGGRIFLTAFEPETSLLGRVAGKRGRLWVLAFDLDGGWLVWRREVAAPEIENTTGGNGPASPTPATDGSRVYAWFGSYGVAAFSMEGEPAWRVAIGPFPHHMGSGSSPVLSNGRLLLNVETDGPSHRYSIAAADGRVIWRVRRRTRQAAYATPVPWNGRVVVAGHESVTAYDAADGRELWTAPGLSTYVVPTPAAGNGLLYATSSGPGGNAVLALRPDGGLAWSSTRGAAYVASPVVEGTYLYTINRNCVMSSLDARDGRLSWQERLGTGGECDASPVAAGGQIHAVTGSGEIWSMEAGAAFRRVAVHAVGDAVKASPAIARGVMVVRSRTRLHAFAGRR